MSSDQHHLCMEKRQRDLASVRKVKTDIIDYGASCPWESSLQQPIGAYQLYDCSSCYGSSSLELLRLAAHFGLPKLSRSQLMASSELKKKNKDLAKAPPDRCLTQSL
ncbi:hypothetical protein A4A49_32595 [Nicotiana attenuata]|uniref:Uncharacterized protein n=1 Tax=Nicotiana attenuata TaxID=49451 RepID=A0A1J6IGW2_NICAT|nr:hypothetical protein A4A49_32595 [Nicotiana attenuata]